MAELRKQASSMKSNTQRILVVGSSGSGKSSLVNLLCKDSKAPVSTGLKGCTFNCQDYPIKHEDVCYFLTDTVGFDEPKDGGTVSHENAIKSLVKFAKGHQSGFNLILFVMKKDRMKKSFVDTYNFFDQVLFSEEVPCVLYISNTEVEEEIDIWLDTERQHFEQRFRFKQIICGTTKVSKKPKMEEEFAQLRAKTYDQVWLAIKSQSLAESFQMNTSLSFWARAINSVYYLFSFGGTYYKPQVHINLEKQLRDMNVKEDTIREIMAMI